MQTPSNSADQSAAAVYSPIHIHVVDEFNVDWSLDVASSLLASPHLASCSQVRISTSGLHPQLSAHPKLASSQNDSTASSRACVQYGSTTFGELQPLLGWDDRTLSRNELISLKPRNFLSLDRKLTQRAQRFDLVLCSSAQVYEAVCQYYASSSFSTSPCSQLVPKPVFVIFIDSKFYQDNKSSSSSGNRPTQGTLLTSFVVEILDLINLQQRANEADQNSINYAPQVVVNNAYGTSKWKEEFGNNVKQFEQFRRLEILFKAFVI